ncbi:MAG: uracil-DNA glycosylase [bacterium]|nr:uracil-DNA glycosylase [bacterium]
MLSCFENLLNNCSGCRLCDLHKTRNNIVFGSGNKDSSIMFIGEAPGENEDLSGKPFMGRSGRLLDRMLSQIGLSRDNIFIANIVKCRPPLNRNPNKTEISKCIPYLFKQIEIINPKIIVCLGRVAACEIISKDFKVTSQHGQWICKNQRMYMGTFHPAALLRNPNNIPFAEQDFFEIKKQLIR